MKKLDFSRVSSLIDRFFFTPSSPLPLAVLRIVLCSILIYQALALAPFIFDLFGKNAIIQGPLTEYLSNPYLWTVGEASRPLAALGIGESEIIWIACIAYIVSLTGLLLGYKTRISGAIAWILHLTLMNTAPCTNYGADQFLHISLFYLMLAPCGDVLSIDTWLHPRPSSCVSATVWLRIIQIHLCIAYLASGLEKAVGVQWWNGEVIWRSLNLPVYAQFDMSWIAQYPGLMKLGAWGTLVIEIGYPFFIWSRRTRLLWVALVASLHVGIAIFLGLGVFGLVMLALTLCAFGLPMLLAQRSSIRTVIGEEISLGHSYA